VRRRSRKRFTWLPPITPTAPELNTMA